MNEFLWGVYPYLCLALFFLVPILRMATQPFTWTTRASGLFGSRLLGFASTCFHWGLFGLFVGHLAGFVGGLLGWESWVEFFRWLGLVAGLFALTGSVLALARRFANPEVRAMSTAEDYGVHVFLIAIMSLALYQVIVDRLFGLAYTVAPWLAGLVHLRPQPELMASASALTRWHVFLALTFFAWFPFTKLVHLWTLPFTYLVRPYQNVRTSRYVFEPRWDFNLGTDKSWMVYAMAVLIFGFGFLAGLTGRSPSEARVEWSPAGFTPLEGRRLYLSQCARCHGVDGRGDGPGAGSPTFANLPRDLVAAGYHFVSTTNGVASDQDLERTVRQGLAGTGMPAFPDLSSDQVLSLVSYLDLLRRGQRQPGLEIQVPPPPPDSPELRAMGSRLFAANCSVCHGATGQGNGPAAGALVDARGRPVRPADLAAARFKAGSGPDEVYLRVAAGVWGGRNEGPLMPAFSREAGGRLSGEEIWALVLFVREGLRPGGG